MALRCCQRGIALSHRAALRLQLLLQLEAGLRANGMGQQQEWQGRQIHRSTQPAHILCNLTADSSRGLLHSAWRMPSQTTTHTGAQVDSCWPHPPKLCTLFAHQLHLSLEPLVGGTALQGGKWGERGSSCGSR